VSSPAHILYFVASKGIPLGGPSGASRHLEALSRAFHTLGHRVTLCVMARRPGLEPDPPATIHLLEPPASPPWVRGRAGEERWQARWFARQVAQRLESDPPDLILERHTLFSDAGDRLRHHFKRPWILEVNAPLRLERARYEGLRVNRAARRAERQILRRADRLLCVSRPLIGYLEAVVRVPRHRLEWLPNGVDLERFPVTERSPILAAELGLTGHPVIGFCGSLKPWHGLENWIELLYRVRQGGMAAKGLIVGSGPEETAMRARARTLGLSNAMCWTGHLPQSRVADHLAQMDLLVTAYPPMEPFYFSPLKLREALAVGVPVISSDQGDLAALIGEAGALFPAEDLETGAARIAEGLGDRAKRRRWVAAARARRPELSWAQVAERILSPQGFGSSHLQPSCPK